MKEKLDTNTQNQEEGSADSCKVSSYDWQRLARKNQRIPSGNWSVWLVMAGRGFGKTRTGAEALRSWVARGEARRIALVGETEHETRQVMIEGISGLLSVHPSDEKLRYEPSKRQVIWPNGAMAFCYSGDRPDQLRGPQFDIAWVDELAKFKNPRRLWEQLMFTLRLGKRPRTVVTTTPRPDPLLKELLKQEDTVVSHGSTFENRKNLSQGFLQMMRDKYLNTRLGRQELMAEILEAESRPLWTPELIEKAKSHDTNKALLKTVVAIDPAVTSHAQSDETGIITAGCSSRKQAVVLEDLSLRGEPLQWARIAVDAYQRYRAHHIVAEVNMGGDLVKQMIHSIDSKVKFKAVRATRDKKIRAQPVVALYEQGKIAHVKDFPDLEQQMLTYIPGTSRKSPDRLDALVWALTDLMLVEGNKIKDNQVWSF